MITGTWLEDVKQNYPLVYKKLQNNPEVLNIADKINDFLDETEGEEEESDQLNRELFIRFLDWML